MWGLLQNVTVDRVFVKKDLAHIVTFGPKCVNGKSMDFVDFIGFLL